MLSLLFLGAVAQFILGIDAHIAFTELIHEDQSFAHWQYVRKWGRYSEYGDDITPYNVRWPEALRPEGWRDTGISLNPQEEEAKFMSPDVRCNVNSAPAAETRAVNAGDKVGFWVGWRIPLQGSTENPPVIYHLGPLTAWLGIVPHGQTAQTWDGSGKAWFKIYEDFPEWHSEVYHNQGETLNYTTPLWPNTGSRNVTFRIPPATPNGEYLLRVEHLGLHAAHIWTIGPEFYFSCAQIKVIGGGTGKPGPLTTIPGHYDRYDPILYSPDLESEFTVSKGAKTAGYWTRTPGPAVWKG